MKPEIRFWPDNKAIQVNPGTTVLDASRRARVTVRTRCGGNASCLMCKVHVDEAHRGGLDGLTPNEKRKLGGQADQGVRLACQARIRGNVEVTVQEDPLKAAVRAQLAKQREEEEW